MTTTPVKKKYLSASLVVTIVLLSSSALLIAQPPVLAASKGSPSTTTTVSASLTKTTTAQNTNIEEADNATLVNNQTKSSAEQIIAHCKNDIHCPILALDKLNKTESPQIVLRTFSDLVLLYHESYDDCHDIAHHLGTWLYGYTTNVQEALNYAQPLLCGGAVLHGIFQGYFVTEQVHNVADKNQIGITHHCPVSQEEKNVNLLSKRECVHGLGHGLAELYDYNTTAAVDRCDEFGPQWAQSACARGVFMQNVVRYYETKTKVGDFDKNDMYFPCNRTVEEFMPQCYYYQQSYWLIRSGNNLTDAYAKCDNITPSEFIKSCYQGIGRALVDVVYSHPELAIASCYLGDQAASYYDDCLRGMLKGVLDDDAKTDLPFQFCSLSRPDFKAQCYEIVGMWIKTFSPNQQEIERECSKAPDSDYVINCINANPDTMLHICDICKPNDIDN